MTQQGVTVWFTGLSGAGKSTLARALRTRLREMGRSVEVLDGEEIRKALSPGLGFSKRDRDENIRRIGYIARLLTRHQVAVIVAAISPYRETRDQNRQDIGSFVEVYCRCPLDVVEARDTKGLYKRARRGELKGLTGIDDPYEEPLRPEVIVDTDKQTVGESLEKIWSTLQVLGYV